jgi:hypothetical protein
MILRVPPHRSGFNNPRIVSLSRRSFRPIGSVGIARIRHRVENEGLKAPAAPMRNLHRRF